MPATSYVVTAWEAVATRQGKQMHELPVTFENVQIHQAVPVEEGQKVVLAVLLAPNNRFHVSLALGFLDVSNNCGSQFKVHVSALFFACNVFVVSTLCRQQLAVSCSPAGVEVHKAEQAV